MGNTVSLIRPVFWADLCGRGWKEGEDNKQRLETDRQTHKVKDIHTNMEGETEQQRERKRERGRG